MAACDTLLPPNMTDTNKSLSTGDRVINARQGQTGGGHGKTSRPYTSRSARSTGSVLTQSLPERDLLTRFRHVYAGKGGWYGHKGTKASGPINTGRIPVGFAGKYKRDILKKLSKTLQDQAGQQSSPHIDTKVNTPEENVTSTQGDDRDAEELVDSVNRDSVDTVNTGTENISPGENCQPPCQESGDDVPAQVLNRREVTSSRVDQAQEIHERDSECEDRDTIVSRNDETWQRDLHIDKDLEIDEKLGSLARHEPLNAPNAVGLNESNECLTNSPLNSTRTGNIETDISSLQISAPCVDTPGGADDLHVDFTTQHRARSYPAKQNNSRAGGNSSKAVPRTHKTTGQNSHPGKTGDRTPRCKTLPSSTRSKPNKSLRSKSVKNAGSREAHNIRMTLFSRLSQEAQCAINETRREMGVSPDGDGSLRLSDDSVPSDASDPGDHGSVKDLNIAPDPLGDSEHSGYSRDQFDRQEAVPPSDSSVSNKDYEAMPGQEPKKPGQRTYNHEISLKSYEKSTPGLFRRKAGRGRTAETQISETPMVGGGKSRRKSTEKGTTATSYNTKNKPTFRSSNFKTRLPDIASELDEERGRRADIAKEEAVGHRIPGVGQYSIVPYHMLRRELTFEITPPGYDSRFDGPRLDLNVEDDTPEEIKQLAIAKCTEWLTKHFVS